MPAINGVSALRTIVTRGVVIATNTWSETHVSGGGQVTVVNGYGSGQTQVHSDVTTTREVCIKHADGCQQVERLPAELISIMPGHDVTFVKVVNDNGA